MEHLIQDNESRISNARPPTAVVDDDGLLTGDYRTSFLGIKAHERVGECQGTATSGSGGSSGTGGETGSGGGSAESGAGTGSGANGAGGDLNATGGSGSGDSDGCSCRAGQRPAQPAAAAALLLLAAALRRRRRLA